MQDDNDFSSVINKDKESNPNCSYTSASQQSCSMVNGDYVCEILKKITRHCPNKRPVDIMKKTTTEKMDKGSMINDSNDNFRNNNNFNNQFKDFEEFNKGMVDGFRGVFRMFGGMDEIFKEFENEINKNSNNINNNNNNFPKYFENFPNSNNSFDSRFSNRIARRPFDIQNDEDDDEDSFIVDNKTRKITGPIEKI